MLDVFFFEAFEEEEEMLRHYLPSELATSYTAGTIQEYGAKTPPASLISVRTQSEIPPAWASSVKAILSRSTGYDHLKSYLKKVDQRIPCGYLPLYCNRAVAEQALLLWMALQRKLPLQMHQFQTFYRDGITGSQSKGKTLLVVGVGNIGYELIRIGKGLEMQTLGVDLAPAKSDVTYVDIKEGLPLADIIVCAMNLTPENRAYFHYDLMKLAKKGAIFVNVSRGELSPSTDLLRLLDAKILAGVGLDVYLEEKALADALRGNRESDHPEVLAAQMLGQHPRAICTPHNAFNTHESVDDKAFQSVEQIVSFTQMGKFIWEVEG
ncbi:MAG: NAD(P)-dependent oxidoreductase [Bacteroidota bacterium]